MIAAFLAAVVGLAVSTEQPMTFEEYVGTLQCDVNNALRVGDRVDNRIGFQFASLTVGSEDGEDSSIAGSRARLAAVAKLLEEHPDARVLIEGHVGITAPPELAQSFSEHRAHVIASILAEEFAVCPQRLLARGWGSTISEAAQASTHPNADTAKQGFGWAELFLVLTPCHTDDVLFFPERPDYYSIAPPPPPPAVVARPTSHPIFYMEPGARVGERVALHFFEPRYKLLIRRAMNSDKTFVFCAAPPLSAAARSSFNLPVGDEPDSDKCVAVVVDRAEIAEDGQADVWGVATEALTLTEVTLEPGTGGLMSTTTPLAGAVSATPTETPPPAAADAEVAETPSFAEAMMAYDTRRAAGKRHQRRSHHVDGDDKAQPCPVILHASLFAAAALLGLFVAAHLCASNAPASSHGLRFCPAPAPRKVVVSVAPLPGKVVIQTAEPLH